MSVDPTEYPSFLLFSFDCTDRNLIFFVRAEFGRSVLDRYPDACNKASEKVDQRSGPYGNENCHVGLELLSMSVQYLDVSDRPKTSAYVSRADLRTSE